MILKIVILYFFTYFFFLFLLSALYNCFACPPSSPILPLHFLSQVIVAIVSSHRSLKRTNSVSAQSVNSVLTSTSERPRTASRTASRLEMVPFNGHVFEKQAVKKAAFCNICQKPIASSSIFAKSQAFECRHCHLLAHAKHFDSEADANAIGPCPGEIEVREYIFMAESDADQRRWVSKLTQAIKTRGEKILTRKVGANYDGSSDAEAETPSFIRRTSSLGNVGSVAPPTPLQPSRLAQSMILFSPGQSSTDPEPVSSPLPHSSTTTLIDLLLRKCDLFLFFRL